MPHSPKDQARLVSRFRHRVVSYFTRSTASRAAGGALLCAFALAITCKVHAQSPLGALPDASNDARPADCLPDKSGYLKARLKGSINSELDWGNAGTQCTGAVRPVDGGVRMTFARKLDEKPAEKSNPGGERPGVERLVLVFGIAGLREGKSGRTLPVNVTVIREGTGDFFGTQGDNKCTLDQVTQAPITGIPHRIRSYRVVARGFCIEPARAVRGNGAVLISRFDYAGRVDYEDEADASPAQPNGTLKEIHDGNRADLPVSSR